jgi:CHAD domain-containing protein
MAREDQRRALRNQTFKRYAKRELDRRLKKLQGRKVADKIKGPEEAVRHKIRLQAKKLRYMAEFLEPVSSGKAIGGILNQLDALQDTLGAIHDVVAAEQLLAKLVDREPKLAFAAAIVAGTVRRPHKAMHRAVTAHEKLRKIKTFSSH